MTNSEKIDQAQEENLMIFINENRLYSKYSEAIIKSIKYHFDAKWIKPEKYWELNLSVTDKRMGYDLEFRMNEFKSQLKRKGFTFI